MDKLINKFTVDTNDHRGKDVNAKTQSISVEHESEFSAILRSAAPRGVNLSFISDVLASISGVSDAMAAEPRQDGIKSIDADGIPSFDENHPDFHSYYTENSCSKQDGWCTTDKAYQGLLRYPAPGASGNPVKDEQTGFAIPVGSVRHEVDDSKRMVHNVTLANEHILHPGIVQRWIDESANQVTVKTYGEGTGSFGRMNEVLADSLWSDVDDNIFDFMKKAQ